MVSYDQAILPSVYIQTIIVFLIVFLLSLRLLRSNGLPPGPRSWPVVGSIFYFEKENYLTLNKWAMKYGDIFTVKLGWTTAVILNSYDAVNCTLKKHGDKLADRPIIPIIQLGFTIPGSIVFENGHAWNERRRWTYRILRNFGLGKKSLESRINLEASYLCQEFDKYTDSFNPFHCVNNAVSNIICSITFGDRFDYSDPKFKELLGGMRYLEKHISFVTPVNVIPVLFYTPMYNFFRNAVASQKIFIDDIIHQHLETFDSDNVRDIIDAYIVESKRERVDSNLFTMNTLWRIVLDLFGGGTDSTSTTIMWTILYLVNYPEVQRKVQKEVDEVVGQEKEPTWEDRQSMPYLVATIMEVQRLSNIAPLIARSTTEDIEIKGYKIPAGTMILANLWSVSHDSDYWEKPFEFKPERFLIEDMKTLKKQEAFMPFGTGRRVCIGELLARMELFLFIVNLMQRFTFKVPDDKPCPSVKECVPGIIRSPKPYAIHAIKR